MPHKAPAGFHVGPLSWSNWDLEMVFRREENRSTQRKTLGALGKNMTVLGESCTRATLVEDECSHDHCAKSTLQKCS